MPIKRISLILILSCGLLSAQQPDSTRTGAWRTFTYDLESIFGGLGYSYTRPLHWQGEQWRDFGLLMGATGVTYLVDEPVSDFWVERKEDVPKFIRDYGWEIGSPGNNYMMTGVVYLTGLISGDEKLRRTGVLLVASASATGLLQQIGMRLIGRARPLSGQSPDTFKPFFTGNNNYHSFPSGHTVLAFTNAYAIAKQFRNPWVKAGIYTLGLVPGISRLWEGKHWLSDVLFSVGLSIFTVEAVDRYLDRRYSSKYNDRDRDVSWDLRFGPGTIGVGMRF